MHYGNLITRALAITWRHKYLWLLALFAGEGAASVTSPSFSGSSSSSQTANTTPSQAWTTATTWAGEHIAVLVFAGMAVLAVAVALFLLSAIAGGALVRASAEHDAERPFSLGLAWHAGVTTFWPVLKVKLLTVAVALVSVIVIGGLVTLAVLSAVGGAVATTVVLALLTVLLGLLAIPFSIVFSVVILLMLRAVVLDGMNISAALAHALTLFQRRLGRVALLWVLSLALGLAAGLALGVFTITLLVVFGTLVAALYVTGGTLAAIIAGALLAVPWLGLVLVASGAISAFISTYWTLGYTRLDMEPLPQVATLPPAAAA
jgi:hypothetical protein